MTKKAYMNPAMNVVKIQQRYIICVSMDANGMNKNLQNEEVDAAWSQRRSGWDNEEGQSKSGSDWDNIW